MKLPDGFSSGTSRVNGVRLHHLTGGAGPPLLMVPGWPQTWYAWRFVMPRLAQRYSCIVVEPRGMGESEKPEGGYDLGSMATDMAALMQARGHERYRCLMHDVGTWIGYALACDFPEQVEKLVVIDAAVPGLTASPPLLMPPEQHKKLWHFAFNQVPDLPEQLVSGRERQFIAWQFNNKSVNSAPLLEALDIYAEAYAKPDALRASFGWYRATQENIRQNQERAKTGLKMPVMAIGGAGGLGAAMETAFAGVAQELEAHVIENCGHYVPEEAPEELLALVEPFLAD